MVTVRRTSSIAHSGVEGMKWGYNDGKRNGKRTAAEISKVAEEYKRLAKYDDSLTVSSDMEAVYNEANSMLKYLGITLDLQSDDRTAAQTIAIYNNMKDSKSKFPTQHEWLKEFSRRLSLTGYDMKAVDAMLDQNKDALNKMTPGTGAGASSTSTSTDFVDAYKKNKVKREAVKKHDKEVSKASSSSKSKKKDEEEDEEEKKKSAKHSENQNGNELYHHGILDMKWGVRRFQNKDGSLTDAGRKRYGYSARRSNSSVEKLTGQSASEYKESNRSNINKQYEKSQQTINDTKNSINNTLNTARSANKLANKVEESQYRKRLSKMSNEELEAEISKAMPEYEARILRQQLEQKYKKIVGNTNSTKEGRETVMNALEVVGGVALTSVAVLDLILKVKSLT